MSRLHTCLTTLANATPLLAIRSIQFTCAGLATVCYVNSRPMLNPWLIEQCKNPDSSISSHKKYSVTKKNPQVIRMRS